MLIAYQKRQENIAEYILYMWQIEDIIRACNFDINLIEQRIISQYSGSARTKNETKEWYVDLILMMHEERIKENGHLRMFMDFVEKLQELHYYLVHINKDPKYLEQYYLAIPNIRDFEKRLNGTTSGEIETCLCGVYALLLLRLQKKEVSQETLDAMHTFSNLLALLSAKFKKSEERIKKK
jgi:hypothetical protein